MPLTCENFLVRLTAPIGLLLCVVPPVFASGGEHLVDDATVEEPGTCHLETWITFHDHGSELVNLSPACTPEALPNLEIAGNFQHGSDGALGTVGPALKFNLRKVERGIGLAALASGAWSLDSGALEAASLIIPVTLPVGDRLRFNLNGGWAYARTSTRRHAAFYGAQAEVLIGHDLGLMVETFRRAREPMGAQAGLRWSPAGSRLDFDIIVGRRIDGATPRSLSLGFTLRR